MLFHSNVAIVCIAKDEPTFAEWATYHRNLGFDRVFVYQNDWDCPFDAPWLTKLRVSGFRKQIESYNHFIQELSDGFTWVALLDCDEFLCLKETDNVHQFLSEYSDAPGLAINLCLFGSGNQLTIGEDPSLLKRFQYRAGADDHVKMILNLGHQHLVLNPHYTRDHLIDTDRRWIKGAHNHNGPIDKAQVNHYYFKSLEEWEIRCNTPRGNGIMRPRDYWHQSRYAYSKIHDTTALDFAIKTGVVRDR